MGKGLKTRLLVAVTSVVLIIFIITLFKLVNSKYENNEYTLKYIGRGIVYENEKINESDYQLVPKYGNRTYNLSKLPSSWSYRFVSNEYTSDIVKVLLNDVIELSTTVDFVTIDRIVWLYGDSVTIPKYELKKLNIDSIRGTVYYSNNVSKSINIESAVVLKKTKKKAVLELWDGNHVYKWKVKTS